MKLLLPISLRHFKKPRTLLCLFILVLVLLNIIQDLLKTGINGSAFYLSESFMFSSFWWIFIPVLFVQQCLLRKTGRSRLVLWSAGLLLPVAIHLIAFPLLVWGISGLCYYHTYTVGQTFLYTLSAHFYQLLIGYAVPIVVMLLMPEKAQQDESTLTEAPESTTDAATLPYLHSLVIAKGDKRLCIAVTDIFYCTANTPYIDIHLSHKKYLHSATLKSIATQLDNRHFVRVHKSTLVNATHIRSYTSRHNGDYDITMNNGALLRLSRRYAADFKRRLQENTPLTR